MSGKHVLIIAIQRKQLKWWRNFLFYPKYKGAFPGFSFEVCPLYMNYLRYLHQISEHTCMIFSKEKTIEKLCWYIQPLSTDSYIVIVFTILWISFFQQYLLRFLKPTSKIKSVSTIKLLILKFLLEIEFQLSSHNLFRIIVYNAAQTDVKW